LFIIDGEIPLLNQFNGVHIFSLHLLLIITFCFRISFNSSVILLTKNLIEGG